MRIKTTIVLDFTENNIRQIGDFCDLTNEEVKQQLASGEISLDDMIDEAWRYYEEPCSRVVVEN